MHRAVRNYQPQPTDHGVVCPPSQRRERSPAASIRSLAHFDASVQSRIHNDKVALGHPISSSPDRKGAAASRGASPAATAPRSPRSPRAYQHQHQHQHQQSAAFDYEAEVERLLAVPGTKPKPPPRGAPSFVIVASSDLARDGGVPVALATTFDRARNAASSYWRVPKYNDPPQPQTPTNKKSSSAAPAAEPTAAKSDGAKSKPKASPASPAKPTKF